MSIAGEEQTTIDGGGGGAITTAIAIDKDKNSQYAVKWALENVANKMSCVALLHVVTQTALPHDAEVGEDGRQPTEAEMQQFFFPFRAFCAHKGVRTKEVVLQGSDVSDALIVYINSNAINHLVVGSPSRVQALTRAFKSSSNVATSLQRSLPETCNFYVVSKRKNQKMKSAISTPTPNSLSLSRKSAQNSLDGVNLRCKSESVGGTTRLRRTSFARSIGRRLDYSDSILMGPKDKSNSINGLSSSNTDLSCEILDKIRSSDVSGNCSQDLDLENEILRLKFELKKTMDVYHSACKDATNAKQKASEIDEWISVQGSELRAMMEIEKQKSKAAIEAAQMAQRLAELEALKRKKAELKAELEAAERNKLMLITAKSPMGLTHLVSRAIKEGNLLEVLDPAVTDWPLEDTLCFAKLALQCCELRKRDRPDLGSVILPELKRLRELGDASYTTH